MLCDASRYHTLNYVAQTPPVTEMSASPPMPSDLPLDSAARLEWFRANDAGDSLAEEGQHPAASPSLVKQFFLSPTSQGSREERLEKVSRVLRESLGVQFHLPIQGESREQYWRRLGAHYAARPTECSLHEPTGDESSLPGDPFYLVDFGRVVEQMARWRAALPMVRPFYAVKCNPYPPLLQLLSALGAGFDCASKREIELVHPLVERSEEEIIFANPCKRVGDLAAAKSMRVVWMTFDNEEELEKIAQHYPTAKAVLRLATDDRSAVCAFSSKFGAPRAAVPRLLECAAERHVSVSGVSFHVGSGNSDVGAYKAALKDAKEVFDLAATYGHCCSLLDIGGGYPGSPPLQEVGTAASTLTRFETIAAAIRPILERDFSNATIISEPGRYFTEASHALLMSVYAKRLVHHAAPPPAESLARAPDVASSSSVGSSSFTEYQYYVNDGLYHSFNCIFYDHAHPRLLLLNDHRGVKGDSGESSEAPGRPLHISTIFGPTCDALDCLLKQEAFPEMCIGDWLLVPEMGSYTTAAGCAFNGIATKRFVFISSILV